MARVSRCAREGMAAIIMRRIENRRIVDMVDNVFGKNSVFLRNMKKHRKIMPLDAHRNLKICGFLLKMGDISEKMRKFAAVCRL